MESEVLSNGHLNRSTKTAVPSIVYPQLRSTSVPTEETAQQKRKDRQNEPPKTDKLTADKHVLRALELYSHLKTLDAQREANNRSLMLAAAGVVVLVGGAAATATERRVMSQVGIMVAVLGGLAEVCGLFAFVKSA